MKDAMGNQPFMYVLQEILYFASSERQWQIHKNDDYRLFIIMNGMGKLVAAGETIKLAEGKCVIISPNNMIEISVESECFSFYQLSFTAISLGDSKQPKVHEIFSIIGELRCLPVSQCNNQLEIIYRNRLMIDELSIFEQHVRFQEFMLFILQQNLPKLHKKNDRQSVEYSIDYIHEHYEKDWTVEQLSHIADVPRWNYSRIFKEITGHIPLHYLNNIRIDRAKQLLSTTNDRIFEISQTVGFNNEYYFNRRFKEHVGVSPGQYRKSHSNNIRVFAPFLEDFLVALGITPIAQFSHAKWGKQEYLGLQEVPDFDVADGHMEQLLKYKPNLIMLNAGVERWDTCHQLNQLAPICHLSHPGEDWRSTLYKIADLTGRTAIMKDVIRQYEHKVHDARTILSKSVYGQTVAFLRISAQGISLYAGPECGYTGPILYRDLGLMPHPLVWNVPHYTRRCILTNDQLSKLDAHHLFITFDKQHSTFEGEERNILTSPIWLALSAVKSHCVYEVDFLTWMNYGVLSHRKKIEDVLHVLE